MTASLGHPPSGPVGVGVGTGLRFVLLLLVLVAASLDMLGTTLVQNPGGVAETADSLNCLLAGGLDPDSGDMRNILSLLRHPEAMDECFSAADGGVHWPAAAGTACVLAAALLLYWWLPLWRGRPARVVPVDSIDEVGSLTRELTHLTATAQVTAPLRFVVAPAAFDSGAVAFGRPGRYTVCLHGGLVARRATDPEGFRAVVLHELSHIRKKDVDLTYATVALWRVFIVLVLLPYTARIAWLLTMGWLGEDDSIFWPTTEALLVRGR